MDTYRLDLKAIEQSLREVQREFPKINESLQSRRDSMTDAVLENMLAGYTFVEQALADGVDLFTLRHATALLELNHIVLCGLNEQVRQEYQTHIETTTQRFYEQEECNIDDILRWYYKHEKESAWKRAAGVYVRILSQPQLYIEGNHRTGALIMSYLLVREGKAPFVLTVDNAKAYFDPSSLIKETRKSPATLLMKLPGMKKRFARFLEGHADAQYLEAPSQGRR
jgi:prophage maintenance system killer protein